MTAILVVDDSAVDRRLICGLLGKEPDWSTLEAENGLAALAMLKEAAPDVVITDLQMPEMDGLMLLAEVRARYPAIPVVLVTAHGSELLAVEALKCGAASYVPKSHIAGMLSNTVREVLAVARGNRIHERLVESIAAAQIHFTLQNDPALIDAAVDMVQRMLARVGVCDPTGRMRVAVALEQALRNALYHGNLELTREQIEEAREASLLRNKPSVIEERLRQPPYCRRRISLDVSITPMEARFVVRDEGPGFDVAASLGHDREDTVVGSGGRGLLLMRSFMDEVTYNDRGNQVTLVKDGDWC
ncbi:MAG: response regulator [Pirellulales bacterium]|nr:response regulator [Pirellulales bacterium]